MSKCFLSDRCASISYFQIVGVIVINLTSFCCIKYYYQYWSDLFSVKECFTGRLSAAAGPGHIKFDNVEINEGLSYNNVTGVFTAKRNGYYNFYLTARTRTSRHTKMELRRNGVVAGSITNDVLVEHGWEVEDGATAILLDLTKGDQITVYANETLQDGSTMSCFSLRSSCCK